MVRVAKIVAAFILCVVCFIAALALDKSAVHWIAPAYADALAFGIVGVRLLRGVEDARGDAEFKGLMGMTACMAVALALYFSTKHYNAIHFPIADWMLGLVCLIVVCVAGRLLIYGFKKLREDIEPFGPRA